MEPRNTLWLSVNVAVYYLVSIIILPVDDEKLDKMTCLELNQLCCGYEYKVCIIDLCFKCDIAIVFSLLI